jgi:hypothetical protein
MTPTVREVLQGVAIAVSTPPSADAGPEYLAARMGMVATLAMLAAQEADLCPGATVAENAAMRAMFAEAAAHDAALGGRLAEAAAETETDFTVTALDAANARLRRLLIALHEHVEGAGDAGLNRRIVALYGQMARGRRLQMPGG